MEAARRKRKQPAVLLKTACGFIFIIACCCGL
jgi:hypothetical protein